MGTAGQIPCWRAESRADVNTASTVLFAGGGHLVQQLVAVTQARHGRLGQPWATYAELRRWTVCRIVPTSSGQEVTVTAAAARIR